jgi:hypothetical protein
VRGALEVELVAGFLWATCGYAYATAGTDDAHLSGDFGDLGGHTGALGLEVAAGGFTVTLGWSRTWAPSRSASASAWLHDNPFELADHAVPPGSYDGSRDMVGLTIEGELDAPAP